MRPTKLTYTFLFLLGIFLIGYFAMNLLQDVKAEGNKKGKTNGTLMEYSKYPGVDLITDITDKKKYHISMHYPKFKSEKLNEEIEEYVSTVEKDFLKTVNDNKKYIKDYSANLSLAMDIYEMGENSYSIVFSEGSYVAGANAQQKAKVYLVDIDKGNFIQQTKIFNDTKQNREQLYTLLYESFKKSSEYEPLLFEKSLKEWTMNKENNFSNLYFTDKSAVFKFDKYEVTAGAAGMPEISIPLEKMRDLLKDEWKDRLWINNTKKDDKSDKDDSKDNQIAKEETPDRTSPTGGKRVALTFDDGPHPKNTLKIIDLLDKYDAKATFFMLGNRVNFYPEIAKKVADAGHELGNHTWNHKDLSTLSKEEGIQEVEQTNEIIKSTTGRESTAFRPPYGAVNEKVQNSISTPSVFWTIDTLDWQSHNPNEILKIVKENIKDGSIILMHDIHETSAQAVEPILKYLKTEGYECVTVSEL
ncbi:polysaccharide deacetylase family protein [Bacillus paralicheniformis]|uniref:polysaccharide deacetylase family protein n=1 Tax=Bacillus paralicheniformis TaxID=1648923 RepID=UPI00186B8510|nr:polysaccharide deacetylase family protein [Bacillus paralicheniformis]